MPKSALASTVCAAILAAFLTACGGEAPLPATSAQAVTTPAAVAPTATPSAPSADDSAVAEPTQVVISLFVTENIDDLSVPPWEDFEVKTNEVTWIETVTAIGETDGIASPLGRSCEQLLRDEPSVVSCEEVSSQTPVRGARTVVGNLNADGTFVLEAVEFERDLIVSATALDDALCSWFAHGTIAAGEQSLELPIVGACA